MKNRSFVYLSPEQYRRIVNKQIWKCPECGETFADFKEAERHINDCIAWNDERRGSESL